MSFGQLGSGFGILGLTGQSGVSAPLPGALGLLYQETQGFAADATFTQAGSLAVIDTGTPANNKSNVAFVGEITQSGTSAKWVKNAAGTWIQVSSGALAQHYVPGKGWALLNEPQRANVILQSSAANLTWSPTVAGLTIGVDSTAGPNGLVEADSFIEDGSTASFVNYQSGSFAASGTFVFSYFVKPAGRRYWMLSANDGLSGNYCTAVFDLTRGELTRTGAAGTFTILDAYLIPDILGYFRLVLALSTSTSVNQVKIGTAGVPTPTIGAYGDVTASVGCNGVAGYLWHAQGEVGIYPTSIVPTTTVTVTRNADKISKLLSSIPFDAAHSTMYFDFTPIDPTTACLVGELWKTTNDRTYCGMSAGAVSMVNVSGGSLNVNATLDTDPIAANQLRQQVTIAMAANDFEGSANGKASATAAAALTASAPDTLYLGSQAGVSPFHGYINRVAYAPRRVSNPITKWFTDPIRLVTEGSSITAGSGGGSFASMAVSELPRLSSFRNQAVGGNTLVNLQGRAAATDALATAKFNILSVFIGLSYVDINQWYIDYAAYLDARRRVFQKVILMTDLPRTEAASPGYEAQRAGENTTLRTWLGVHCDAICDFGAHPIMGVTAAAADTSLYDTGIHPTVPLGQRILAPTFRDAVLSVVS